MERPAPFRSSRDTWLLGSMLLALVVGGCDCAIGEYVNVGDANPPGDLGTDTNPPVDLGMDQGPVDMGMVDMGDSCGDGIIDTTETGEVCDPNASISFSELLRCICPTDNDNCTDDVWVPDPSRGVCFGSCQHVIRTGYGINTCDDGVACTVDTIVTGSPATCDVTCTNLPPYPTDTTCNGFDDDCDGTIDDDYVVTATTCGTGPCSATGQMTCQNGMPTDTCVAGNPGANDDNCDGIDQNCNGSADEGYQPVTSNCGVGACQAMGTTSCSNGMVQSNCTPLAPGPSDITCDGIDQNCNGVADEGYTPVTTSCGVGACRANGVSICYAGGQLGDTCMPGSPTTEVCDGIDNDCDTFVDDGNPGGGASCAAGQLGECNNGTTACVNGGIRCNQTTLPAVEVCNGLDDNCDGVVDNIAQTSCGTGLQGVCAAGTSACSGGMPVCIQTTMASNEVCDGLDNDCDGQINDGNPGGNVSCNTGEFGVCQPGTTVCTATDTSVRCVRNTNPSIEVCDGADNDCDGLTDVGTSLRVTDSPAIGNSCSAAATRSVSVNRGATVLVSGTVDGLGDDYITVTFNTLNGPGQSWDPQIDFSYDGGGQYVFNVLNPGGCSNYLQSCNGGDITIWSMSFTGAQDPGCLGALPTPNCTDNLTRQSTFVVRVRRKNPSSINCTGYTLRIVNP